jgi:hypothetical protein
MCNCTTAPQISAFGAGGGGGKTILATTPFTQININTFSILYIYRHI